MRCAIVNLSLTFASSLDSCTLHGAFGLYPTVMSISLYEMYRCCQTPHFCNSFDRTTFRADYKLCTGCIPLTSSEIGFRVFYNQYNGITTVHSGSYHWRYLLHASVDKQAGPMHLALRHCQAVVRSSCNSHPQLPRYGEAKVIFQRAMSFSRSRKGDLSSVIVTVSVC